MPIETHRKIDLAAEQLESSIQMYATGKYASAATLAGAAEEILGRHVSLQGLEPDLDNLTEGVSRIHYHLTGSSLPKKDAIKTINRTRNSLKHMDDEYDSTIEVDLKDEAKFLIWRAIHNYDRLRMPYNSSIDGFPANVSGA